MRRFFKKDISKYEREEDIPWYIDEAGNDYRIPLVISLVGLCTLICSILVLLIL